MATDGPERWRRIAALFDEALKLAPERRDEFLNAACGGDSELNREVVELLEASKHAADFLEHPVISPRAAEFLAQIADRPGSDRASRPPWNAAPPEMIGKTLGHYRILEQVGAGGMGVVYRARDEHLDRDVALKVLPAGALADEASRRRFRKEALSLSRLNHPNIDAVYDFDTHEGVDFLVLEYVPGETLREPLRSGPLQIEEVRRLARQLLEGLAAAHAQGVLHRDLKPENLRVTPDGRLKILDFGLATLIGPASETASTRTVTKIDGLRGTPPYMAPEQLRGETVDARTDLFAAGAILYEMATGRRPFMQPTEPLLIEAILHRAPPMPRSLNPAIPEGLEAVLVRALEKEPEKRYQSAAGFLTALDADESTGTPGWTQEELPPKAGSETLRGPWPPRKRLALTAALTVVLGTVTGVGIYLYFGRGAIDSLVVLPFQNRDTDPESEYLSDGMTETIINKVSELPAVKVISRNSSFHYKGRKVEPREAARELKVRAVLAGYIQRQGQDLVVSAELVDTQSDRHLWGQRYTAKFSDVLRVEEDIAARISEEMRLRLTGEEKRRLMKRPTEDPEAHTFYLKGRHVLLNQWGTKGGAQEAIDFFNRAIAADPGYALAYVGLADSYYSLSDIHLKAIDAMPRARAAALRALELDDELGAAHASLGVIKRAFEWDLTGSQRELRRAIDLAPSDASAHMMLGMSLAATANAGEAEAEIRRALELDPLEPFTRGYSALSLYLIRRYEQAESVLKSLVAEDPKLQIGHAYLGLVYEQMGRSREAVEEFRTATRVGESTEALAQLGHALAVAGEREEAIRVLGQLEKMSASQYVNPFSVGLIHAGLGDLDQSFAWFDRAVEDRCEWISIMAVDPRLDGLRDDPRFQALLKRVGIAPGLSTWTSPSHAGNPS